MKYFYFFILVALLFSCSKDSKEISIIKESSQEMEMISSYNEAFSALEMGDPYFAAKKFLEAEILYPQSKWAPKSA